MRFLMTSNTYPPYHVGGDGMHVKYLAEALAEDGHEVHVLFNAEFCALKTKKKVDLAVYSGSKVRVHGFRSRLGKLNPMIIDLVGNSREVTCFYRDLIHSIKPDVVHHHNRYLLGYNLFRKQGDYLSVYTAHDYDLLCPIQSLYPSYGECNHLCFLCSLSLMRPPQLWRFSRGYLRSLKGIDLIISPSSYLAERLAGLKLAIPIEVLLNFVPMPPKKIRESDQKDYFLYAGMLDIKKGIMELIHAFSGINRRLIIVGQGKLHEQVEASAREHPHIDYLGWVNHETLLPLMRSANAVILPSKWLENMPLTALESLSVGTPVIGSDKGGIPEIIGKLDTKLIYSTEEQLREIIVSFDRCNYPERKVKEVFLRHFAPGHYVKKYLALVGGAG